MNFMSWVTFPPTLFYIDISDVWFCSELKKNIGRVKYTWNKTALLRLVLKTKSLASPVLFMQMWVYKEVYHNGIKKVVINALT